MVNVSFHENTYKFLSPCLQLGDYLKKDMNTLLICVFVSMVGLGIISPLLPLIAESLGATGLYLGLIFSAFSLSRMLLMPVIGRLSDKRGRKKFIVIGLLLYSLVSLGYVIAKDIFSLLIVRFIHGIASAMVLPIAMAYIGDLSEKGKEGGAMGKFNAALFLGMSIGPLLGGLISGSFGMSAPFYCMSVLSFVAFFMSLLFLSDYIRDNKNDKPKHNSKGFISLLSSNKLLRDILLYRFILALGRGGIMAFLPILASQVKLSLSQIGLLVSFTVLLSSLLQIPLGKLSDKSRSRWGFVIVGGIISSLGFLLLPFAKDFFEFLIISFIIGLGGSISMPALSALITEIGREIGMGNVSGLFNSVMSLGMIISSVICGMIMDTFGIAAVFYFNAITTIMGTAYILFSEIFRRRGEKFS